MTAEPAKIQLWALPPVWGSPSPSPFAIKLMTWLRMARIEYETPPMTGPPRSSTGKIPYVRLPDGELLADSGQIIARLSSDRGIDLDAHLDPRTRAIGHAVRRMVEEHLYFAGIWDRWIRPEGYAYTRRDYFRHLPAPARALLPALLRRRIRAYAHGQGLGRHPGATIASLARQDAAALSEILGDQPYMLGAQPCTLDATTHGFLWAMSSHPWDSPVRDAVREHANLTAYVERMRERYWSDWAAPDPAAS